MTRIPHRPIEELADLAPLLGMFEQVMGFVPNSLLAMAHRPDLVQAFAGLASAVLGGGTLPHELRQLVAFVASNASGCRYCQAHTSHAAHRGGVSEEKIQAAFEYETSPLFSEPERAALRLAARAAVVPNLVEDADMAAVRTHFGDPGAVDLVAVIALFGWLNRWNDTLATTLEQEPAAWAGSKLGAKGWAAGKHGVTGARSNDAPIG